ncbi:MAG: site-specific DNA-methyltransferase [Elusimicrobia bacterium]|nr:site-specific DNA-methyltransferase [Elusimicrobiota bacterium]
MPQKCCEGQSPEQLKELIALYADPLPATRTGPLYNAFSYPTKISPEAIAIYIATHTKPGATILDTFAGSGTTGLATLLCDKPTEGMKQTAIGLGLNPVWGPRKAVLYELSVIGAFISETLCSPPNPIEFEKAANSLLDQAEEEFGWLWKAADPSGKEGEIRHVIWSDVLLCPQCKKEVSFWDTSVRVKPARLLTSAKCPNCGNAIPLAGAERPLETYFDPLLNRQLTRKKRIPIRIHGRTGTRTWQRAPLLSDLKLIEKANKHLPLKSEPKAEIFWGDLYRSGYHKGISHLHHFYTRRNFLAIASLWAKVEQFPPALQKALRLLILSYNASHSTLMTRIVAKKGLQDFVITGAQSGVLYISSLPIEKNVFIGIRRKIKAYKEAFLLISHSHSSVKVLNKSSTRLKLANSSIDYVFTDPPFGDYIPYAEINQINEAWLGKTTNRTEEAIMSVAQGKTLGTYQSTMLRVFKEISRVLKPSGKATVVFHSAKAEVWHALTAAYGQAGLRVAASSVLDKVQASFKQVVSRDTVKGAPLLLLIKGRIEQMAGDSSFEKIYNEVLACASAKQLKEEQMPARLYSRYITRCLELGVPVKINADEFYKRIRVTLGLK